MSCNDVVEILQQKPNMILFLTLHRNYYSLGSMIMSNKFIMSKIIKQIRTFIPFAQVC